MTEYIFIENGEIAGILQIENFNNPVQNALDYKEKYFPFSILYVRVANQ